jgi:hypothetical protein
MKQAWCLVLAVFLLSSCGGGDSTSNLPVTPPPSLASSSDIVVSDASAGATPFIALAQLTGNSVASLKSIAYTIAAKSGTVSKPVHVTYSMDALARLAPTAPTPTSAQVPIFGLYAGYTNNVSLTLTFTDNSTAPLTLPFAAAAYTDPNAIYDKPMVIKARAAGSSLGFDYFAMKSMIELPVIVDTDGELRWVGTGVAFGNISVFADNGFYVGDPNGTTVYRAELSGALSSKVLTPPPGGNVIFHHNFDLGKVGVLSELNVGTYLESTISEFTLADGFVKTWDIAAILSNYMSAHGDDPTLFVRPGYDWFHSNAATYDPSDNSIIVSSREDFLIKLDYDTGDIIWILGDPTKYWYTFPSLRAKALTLQAGGLYPIGQHGVSITSKGLVMVMNDGFGSASQPSGAPTGETRTYSAVSAYSIDAAANTATEVWHFDYGQTIYSDICGSAYEASDQSVLVNYAVADTRTHARLVGLDSQRNVVFDFQYPTNVCNTSWNAEPIPLDNMQL